MVTCPHCGSVGAEPWDEPDWFRCPGCERDFFVKPKTLPIPDGPVPFLFAADAISVMHEGKEYTDGDELISDVVSAEVDKISRHPRGGSWTGLEGEEFCHKCNRDTKWLPMRKGSKRVKCEGCGDVYPCRTKCDHLDCADDRKEMKL